LVPSGLSKPLWIYQLLRQDASFLHYVSR